MVSIIDNLKEGLKYPLYEPKKLGILAGLSFIMIFLLSASFHVFFNSLKFFNADTLLESGVLSYTNLEGGVLAFSNMVIKIPTINITEIGIFLFFSFIIFVFISGYLYKVIEFTIEGKNTIPEFNKFLEMFISGIKLCIVGIIYSIIPSILIMIGLYLVIKPNLDVLGFIILGIGLILAIIFTLIEIMACSNMVANGNLRSAFDFKYACNLISSIGWIRFIGAIIFLMLVINILSICAGLISDIILMVLIFAGKIGFYIGIFIIAIICVVVGAYLNIVSYRFIADLYNEAIKK